MFTITPFHDCATDLPTLYKKIQDCTQVSRIIGREADGTHIYIVIYWDTVENRTLVYHNKKYVYVDSDSQISINNILKAFGLSYLDVNVTKQFLNDKSVTPDNKILDTPILESMMNLKTLMSLESLMSLHSLMSFVELTPNIHNIRDVCGDGIDSDDYNSE